MQQISYWKMVNIVLLGASLIGMLFMFYSTIPKVEQKKETISYVHIIKNPAFIFYILIFGFYFIAEHGILNWFMLYGINGLELEYDRASFFLSIFFGGDNIRTINVCTLSPNARCTKKCHCIRINRGTTFI